MSDAEKLLTHRQTEVLRFIYDFQKEHGYCVTYGDLMTEFVWASVSTAHNFVQRLLAHKYVGGELVDGRLLTRTLHVTLKGYRFLETQPFALDVE